MTKSGCASAVSRICRSSLARMQAQLLQRCDCQLCRFDQSWIGGRFHSAALAGKPASTSVSTHYSKPSGRPRGCALLGKKLQLSGLDGVRLQGSQSVAMLAQQLQLQQHITGIGLGSGCIKLLR